MSKNIVLCSDGTGNSPGKRGAGTNVWKIFRAVDVHRDNAEQREQMAFYDDGVGTGNLKLVKALGGAFGWGLSRNIRDLYSFLVHHYEPGDRIFLFGFSRGAFTVRSLAGLICSVGIVDRNKSSLRRPLRWDWIPWRLLRVGKPRTLEDRVREAFRVYRRAYRKKPPVRGEQVRPAREAKEAKRFEAAQALVAEFRAEHSIRLDSKDRREGCEDPHDIPIQCIGVWDTADAVGLPVDELTDALDKLFRFKFHRHELHRCVQHGFQALAIDDARHTFHPLLWDESQKRPGQNIEQVWFAGMHSNVGGGYPKDQLALVSLDWMMRKVGFDESGNSWGLHFRPELQQEWRDEANAHGKMYDSRSGPQAYYRYRPRDIGRLSRELQRIEYAAKGSRRVKVHYSVLERIEKATEDYAPVNLPQQFEIVDTEAASPPWLAGDEEEFRWRTLARHLEGVSEKTARRRLDCLKPAWESIWLRRCLYFAFIVASIFVACTANRLSADSAECSGGLEECCEVGWCVFDPLFDVATWATPAIVAGPIAGLKNNPQWLLLFLALAVLMLRIRGRLIRRTTEIGTAAWRSAFGRNAALPLHSRREALAFVLRNSWLAKLFGRFKSRVLPWIVVLAALAGVAWLLWWLCMPAPEKPAEIRCGTGQVAEPLAPGHSRTYPFDARNPCHATDLLLEAGGSYLFVVQRPGGPGLPPPLRGSRPVEWCDASFSASPAGLEPRAPDSTCPVEEGKEGLVEKYGQSPEEYWIYTAAWPFRRSKRHDWFVLLGSVGTGDDNIFQIGEGPKTYAPAATGRLHLYVNDAVCYLCPQGPWAFYGNNRGTARIVVTRRPDPAG